MNMESVYTKSEARVARRDDRELSLHKVFTLGDWTVGMGVWNLYIATNGYGQQPSGRVRESV